MPPIRGALPVYGDFNFDSVSHNFFVHLTPGYFLLSTSQPMKTLRRYRMTLGRFMTMLLAVWQITSPLNAATFYWDSDETAAGNTVGGANLGGTGSWDTSTSNWWDGISAVTDSPWVNGGNTAVFTGTAAPVYLMQNITVGGLTFNVDGYSLEPNSLFDPYERLTFTGATPTVTLASNVGATIAVPISGTTGLTVTGAGAASTLTLTNPIDASVGNNLTGGITINNATLKANVTSTTNLLGTNTINLQAGSVLEITPVASTANGLSERAFGNLNPTLVGGNSSRFDFTSVANKTLLFTSAPATPVDVSTRVVTNGLNYGSMYTTYGSYGTLVDTTNSLNNTGYQWVGQIRITNGGSYQFGTASDDGSRLFVDGVLVVNNDGGKGVTDSSGFITLSAGLHDIRIDNVNGSGGTGEIFRYGGSFPGADQAYGVVANPGVLFQAEINTSAGSSTAIQMLNALNVTGSSTINLAGGDFTQVQFGNFSINTGNTLTVGGLAGKTMRVGAATLGNGAGSITFNATPNIAFDGAVTDGGNAMVINKLGVGRLIFDQTAVANNLSSSTVINMQAGELVLVGSPVAGTFNPIGNAQITLNGGNLILDSKGGNGAVGPTYNNTVNVNANATIRSINNATTTTLGSSSTTMNLASGTTLTLDAITGSIVPVGSLPATLNIAGNIIGDSTTTISGISTVLGTTGGTILEGTIALSGNNSGFSGTVTVADGMTLAVQGNTALVGATINLAGGTSASFFFDGDGTGERNSVAFNDILNITGTGTATVNVGRLGTTYAPLFTLASNKTAELSTLNIGGQTLAVTPANGYGLEITGATTLTGAATFNIGGVQDANVVQALTLSGVVDDGASTFGLIKSGTGTLALENTGNSFGGVGATIQIDDGIVQVNSDAAMGHASNTVTLSTNSGNEGLRFATGASSTYATSRTFILQDASNGIAVTSGTEVTLSTAFNVPTATNGLTKFDKGTLILTASNTGWNGAVAVNGGALKVSGASANILGGGAITIANIGSALQLSGGATISNAITLNANSNQYGGINSGGLIQSVSGVNTISGAVTQTTATAALIGAAAGATLNFTGTYSSPGTNSIGFTTGAGGTINWQTAMHNNGQIFKWGAGTFNLSVASPAYNTALTVNGGTFRLSGTGSIAGTAAITVRSGSVLELDNSVTNANNRLSTRTLSLSASALNYIGNGTAASSESIGALTIAAGQSRISVSGGTLGNEATLTFASLNANIVNVGGFLNLQGIDANNRVVFTTAPTLVGGVIQRAALNGTDLVTATAATPVSAATYTDVLGALSNPGTATTANARLSGGGTHAITDASATVNALVMNTGTATTLDSTVGSTLTLTSGNLLVSGSVGNIIGSGVTLAQGAVPTAIMVNTGASLAFAGSITTNANVGLQKALGGVLDFTGRQYFSTGTGFFDINGGTVKLSAGDHTLAAGQVNIGLDPGATLDLNGSILIANALSSSGLFSIPGSGGMVINSDGLNQATLIIKGTSTFGGQITGNTFVGIAASATFYNDNTYTGGTMITGGTTILRDYGKLSAATGDIDINYGALHLYNDGFAYDSDRLNNNQDITLRGGAISLKGRGNTFVTETVGNVTLAQGTSLIGSTNSTANGGADTVLTLTSLTRNAAAGATVAFTQQFYNQTGVGAEGNNGGNTSDGSLGLIGNFGRIEVTGGVPLTNNIIGGWAVTSHFFNTTTAEFATYVPGLGVAALATPVGIGTFATTAGTAGYDGAAFPVSNQPTQNIRLTAGGTVTAGGSILNALNLASNQTGAVALNFAGANDVLNVRSGGLIIQNVIGSAGATTVGTTLLPGVITAGGNLPGAASDLFLYYYANGGAALTVNSQITDNPTDGSDVRLVLWGGIWSNTANTILANGTNNYTGGTVINQSTLTIGATGRLGTGGLTINGGTLAQTVGGVLPAQAVTINGGGTLTLVGNNTLTSLAFNNNGGTANPTVNTGGVLTITSGAPIIIDSQNVGTTVLINGNLNFSGGFVLNNGSLAGALPIGADTSGSPFGSGDITYNTSGVLSFRSATDAVFGNDINVTAGMTSVNLDVQGTAGPSTITMGNLDLPVNGSNDPTVGMVNVTGGSAANPSTLVLTTNSLTANSIGASTTRVLGDYQTFNVAANTTLAITNGGFARNNEALNIGAGTLLLGGTNLFSNGTTITTSNMGAAPTVNAVTAIYGAGQTVTFNGTGLTYTIAPQIGTIPVGPITGATIGGLQQTFTNVGADGLNVAANWGNGPGSVFNGVLPNDAAADRVLFTNPGRGLVTYNGYLNITTAGTYSFIIGSDDNSALVIDGVEVARDIGAGHGVQDTARGSIVLSAGQHTITMKINVGTGQAGGGSRLLYSGPDTAANGGNNGYMAIPSSALSFFAGPANAGNNYYNAAQIDNDYALTAGSSATLQGSGTDFNSTLKSLTLGNGSTLGVTNDLGAVGVGGTGFMGIIGTTTVGTGVTLNPTTGNLYLIGGVSDGGNGLTKTGAGTLSLNNSAAFTGAFAINGGTVRIFEANALSTGGTTVASGASLDLNGVASASGRNVTINGAGTASQFGALFNSSAATGSIAGTLTLATASTIAGYGDILISGAITSSTLLTKNGPNTLTLTGNNSTMTGGLTISSGVVNNGTLNSGATTALGGGAGGITVNTNSVLNLSGNGTDRSITTNGTSLSNRGPNQNSLGNIINSSISSSFATAVAPAPGSAFMKQANTANTATITGNITMNTGTLGIGSNTFASGGDIIVTGAFSGTQTITKVGGNNLFLRGANTFAGGPTIHAGTLTLDGAGLFNGTGGTITVNEGGSFVLDNGTTFTNNRINNNVAANNRRLVLAGGTLTITGNSTTTNDVTELFSASVAAGNNSGLRLDQGHNNINLTPVSTGGSLTVTVTRAGTNIDLEGANAATALITARNLGQAVAGTDGNANIILTNGLSTAGLHIIGQNSNTANGGANGILNKGISSFIIVDDGTNINFATYDSAANVGIRGLDTGAGTAEYGVSNTNALQANNNILLTANTATTANTAHSLNSLKLTGGTLTLSQGSNINLNSGGILATADATISGPGIFSVDGTPVASGTAGSQNLYIHTIGVGTDLTFDSSIGFTNNNSGRLGELVKAGTGNLILGGANFHTTNTRVQEGTLTLNNDLAIYYRQTMPASTSNFNSSNAGPTLQINQGATLNMNNRDLTVNNLNSINPGGGQGSLSGGTVINSVAGTKNLTINATTNNTWSGNISSGTGAINFSRYGRDTFTITNENSYTGSTIIGGGATTLVDVGALRGTSGVTINAAALIWNDNGTQGDAYRLGAVPADVTFNGGGFQYNGRQGAFSVANLGDVVLASGANQFTANAQLYGNATIQMASFTRNAGAVVTFAGSLLGDDGFVKVTGAAPVNYNGIVGGWALTNNVGSYSLAGGDFMQYDSSTGFRAIVDYKTTGGIDYTGAGLDRPAYGNAAFEVNSNIRVNSDVTMLAGNNVVNSMVIGRGATTTLTYAAAGDTLFIQSGGVLGTTSNDKLIGASVAGGGRITAGNSNGSAGAGNPNYDLYLHNLSSTMTVNAQIVNNGANAVNLITSTGSVSGPVIRLSNTNTYTGSTVVNSTDLRLASTVGTTLANSTSISIVGGNSGAGDSSPQAMSRIFFENAGNQLNSGATVSIINNATLDTNNFNQTLANIVFNNTGGHTGTSNGVGGSVRTGSGTLTLTGSITATNLTNTSTIPFILGAINLNGGQRTITVDAITGAGVQGAAQVGLSIFANMSNGGINKEGAGVLAITGLNTYTGATNVNNGTLVLAGRDQASPGAALTANIGGSRVNVAGTATVDMRGGNAIIGSLNGAGTVTNSVYGTTSSATGMPGTLTLGADNTSTANFSGRFTNFINGVNETTGYALNVTKVGTGIQTISGDNAASLSPTGSNGDINNVGTLDIQEGTILVNGTSGSLGFTAINVKAGATLILDNSVDNKANRLGGYRLTDSANGDTANDTSTPRTISLQGGTIVFKEGSTLMNEGTSSALSMASNPGVGNVTLTSGTSVWLFDDSVGSGGVTINVNQMNAGAGSLHLNAGAGQSLGQTLAGGSSINVYVNGITVGGTAQGSGTIGVIGAALSAGTGVQGNVVGGIRSDITATDSLGTGFVTYDRYGYRLLTNSEYSIFPGQPDTPLETGGAGTPANPPANWAAVNPTITATYTGNALVNSAQTWTTNTTVVSLRLDNGGGLTSAGGAIPLVNSPVQNFNALGTLNTLTVSSGSIIGNTGNLGLTGGAISAGGSALRFTTAANMNVSSYLISTNVGTAFVKDGAGTLNLTRNVYLGSSTDQGNTTVNGGTLQLNAGHNTLAALNTATVSAVDNLTVNAGGTVDLMGYDQVVANITSADTLPGGGGTITNSGAAANLFTNSNSTFGGSINGAVNLYKTGTGNLTLTSSNAYNGTTTVQGGILILQDSGTLASTTYNLNGAQLRYDNRNNSLSDIAARIPVGSTVNMRSGFLMSLGRPGVNVTENIATMNSLEGFNQVRVDSGAGGARALNIDTLNVTAGSQVLFLTGFGTLGAEGANPTISLDSAPTTIGSVVPWAVVQATSDGNNVHVAMYNSTINPVTGVAYGFAAPNQTAGGFTPPNYQATNFNAATTGQNVNQASGTVTEAAVATRSFNSLRFSQNAATTLNLSSAELMRIEAGVIVSAQQTLTLNNGRITSGVSNNTATSLYINPMNNSVTINSQIVDNGSGALTLIKGGSNTLTLVPTLAAGGSQTGALSNATVAGSTTLTLSAAVATTPAVGSRVYGAGIANGTTVVSVAGSVVTLSTPALATTNGGTFGFGDAQVITGTNAAIASGATTMSTITVTNAQAATLFQGATVSGTGMPAGITISSIGAVDSGGAGFTTLTVSTGTASAAIAANQAFAYSSAQISTNSGYSGATIVNAGTLALNGAVGSRSLGGTSLTINSGGIVTMTNAGQIAPDTNLTINGGGSLTFAPVTVVSPVTGGINALNNLTFNNNGGTAVPTVNLGTNGILTIKSGLITSNSDNQGSTPLISNGFLNFGQISLATSTSGSDLVTVADVSGFAVGQTVTGVGIAGVVTIEAINGNTLDLSATIATGATGAITTVNQAAGSTTAMTPTINVTTSTLNKLSSDLQITSVIANSQSWTNLAGGGAAVAKTGNGNLTLSAANTFDNGFSLNEGQVTVGNNAAFGTGTLTIAGGTQLQTDGAVKTITNAVVVNGDFTFGGQQAGHNLTLNGTMSLGGGVRNITVSSPLVTATIGGVISNGGLTKSGNGILTLNGANNYAGGTIINGGLVNAGNATALGASTNDLTVKSNATLNMNNFSLTVDGLNGDNATMGGLITNTGAGAVTLTVGSNNEATASFAGVITNTANALNLVKTGSGTQILNGLNTYTGTTVINAGNLQVGNLNVGQSGTGATSVNGATAVLSGSGTVQGATTLTQGVLRPGDAGGTSTGTLNFTGNLTYVGGSTELQISGGTDSATDRDRLNVTGTLTLSNSSNIQVLFNGFTPVASTTYSWNLLDWGTLVQGGFDVGTNYRTGNNGDLNEGNLDLADISGFTSYVWDVSQFTTSGIVAIVVPEPSRALLLFFGLMALFFRRRRGSHTLSV